MEALRAIRRFPAKSLRRLGVSGRSSVMLPPPTAIGISTCTYPHFKRLTFPHFHSHSYHFPAIASVIAHWRTPAEMSNRHLTRASFAVGGAQRRAYDGLLLDAGGTLLQLARPVEETYATIGRKYGIDLSESEIKQGFKRAFAAPWPEKLRYQGDGRAFWRLVVSEATGCADNTYFEEVYEHFAHGDAWQLPTGAYEGICHLKDAGVKLAVVSNFDTRLRTLLNDLKVAQLFDAIVISAEVGYEKPAAGIFLAALDHIGIEAGKAVHVGDDEKADKAGANTVGIDCWLWGFDVKSFSEICGRVLTTDS